MVQNTYKTIPLTRNRFLICKVFTEQREQTQNGVEEVKEICIRLQNSHGNPSQALNGGLGCTVSGLKFGLFP
jgi:hypothetical protein